MPLLQHLFLPSILWFGLVCGGRYTNLFCSGLSDLVWYGVMWFEILQLAPHAQGSLQINHGKVFYLSIWPRSSLRDTMPLGQLSLLHMKHVRCKHLFHQPTYLPSDLSYSRHNHQESQKMYFKGAAASKGLFQRDLLTTYWSPLGHGRPSLSLLATAHLPLWCGYQVR